jgi:hypothetical protein
MICNKTQTQIKEEILDHLDSKSKEEFFNLIDEIPFIKNLISSDRKTVAETEKDEQGRVIVDFANPHILEDMNYFRPAALHFMEHGTYTFLFPNGNPNSEYAQFWKEERIRCRDGYVREDGEWIPGYYYFYLNYTQIEKVIQIGSTTKEGKTRSERVREFPNIWDSDYLYFHYIEKGEAEGKYGKILKTRGRGYSFKGGAMAARNALHFRKSKSYLMAHNKQYLDKDGIFNKSIDALDWNAQFTPYPRLRLKQDMSNLHYIMGYKDKELNINKGPLSEIMGVAFQHDADKARGKRGKLIEWEEDGIFPKLKTAWQIARMSLEDGRNVFGYMISFGTGGTAGADFEASEEFFYSPKGYNILEIANVYDRKAKGTCGMFVPEYLNRANCYDENGNSNVIKALLEILEDRQTVRNNSIDPNTIIQECADRPITPQEAVMRVEGSFFPVQDLKEWLSELATNQPILDASWKGSFIIKNNEVKFNIGDVDIITKFPIEKHIPGGVEIFEQPYRDVEGIIPKGLYILATDPVDDDGSQTNSLLSTFVMNTLTGRIVAEYTGRPQITDDYFEQLRRLTMYYNGKLLYENNKKGLYGYFKNTNSLHLLQETPEILKDVENITLGAVGNKKYGVNASTRVNAYGLALIKKWLLSPAYSNEQEEDSESIRYNLHTIRSVPLLQELISYHSQGNFDRISALGILMIFREEVERMIDSVLNYNSKDASDDPFWFKGKNNNNLNMMKF